MMNDCEPMCEREQSPMSKALSELEEDATRCENRLDDLMSRLESAMRPPSPSVAGGGNCPDSPPMPATSAATSRVSSVATRLKVLSARMNEIESRLDT